MSSDSADGARERIRTVHVERDVDPEEWRERLFARREWGDLRADGGVDAEAIADDLPWTTAPELVDDVLEELSIPLESKTAELAREWSHTYGVEEPTTYAPSSIAAGAVYFAACFDHDIATWNDRQGRPQQEEVAWAADVSIRSIQRSYHLIAEREGYKLPTTDSDDEPARESDDEPAPSLLSRILERWFS